MGPYASNALRSYQNSRCVASSWVADGRTSVSWDARRTRPSCHPVRLKTPKHCPLPECAHNAALAEIRDPLSFEEILRRFREKAGEELADYLLRTCLRLWTSHKSRLVRHTRRQYEPSRCSTFGRDARKLWDTLVSGRT